MRKRSCTLEADRKPGEDAFIPHQNRVKCTKTGCQVCEPDVRVQTKQYTTEQDTRENGYFRYFFGLIIVRYRGGRQSILILKKEPNEHFHTVGG
jgi:hypothetical protein